MNRRMLMLVGGVLFLLLLAVPVLMAQVGMQGGRGRGARNYNPATEITVNGTVEEVTQTTGRRGWAGTHLTLRIDHGAYDVHVGPAWYISAQQFAFAKGENIEVIGSKTTVGGKEVLLARQITKDGKTLTLRDEHGFPKWSRTGRSLGSERAE
jgi:hypothetical protein